MYFFLGPKVAQVSHHQTLEVFFQISPNGCPRGLICSHYQNTKIHQLLTLGFKTTNHNIILNQMFGHKVNIER